MVKTKQIKGNGFIVAAKQVGIQGFGQSLPSCDHRDVNVQGRQLRTSP